MAQRHTEKKTDSSPVVRQMTLFDEYNAGNGHRKEPKAVAVIVDHVKDKNNDGVPDAMY